MTDQPPSQQQPAEESDGAKSAALAPDGAPTEAALPAPAGAAEPVAPEPEPKPEAESEPEPPAGAPEPPAAFAPADPPPPSPAVTTAPPPLAAATPLPPPVTELPPGDGGPSGPGGLAAAFGPDRPERAVGAAFAGGLVLALILKRLAR